MTMTDCLHVATGAIDTKMYCRLARRRTLSLKQTPLKIDDQYVIGFQTRPTCIPRLNEHAIRIGNASTEMAAVIEQFGKDHDTGCF